jgi:hypothetical protein
MKSSQQLEAKYRRILHDRAKFPHQSVDEYCRGQGVSPWAYYSWKRRLLGKPDTTGLEKKFLPVRLMTPAASVEDGEAVVNYEIAFPNGIRIRLTGSLRSADHPIIIGAIAGVGP